jgi:predicted metallopeptidase
MLRAILLACLLFPPTSILLGYVTSPISTVPTDGIGRVPRAIKLCPVAELYDNTKVAADEWNTAITFFAIRFMWLELLGLRIEVADTGCDAYIMLGKLYEIHIGNGKQISDERILGITYTNTEDSRVVSNVIISDLLPPERRSVVIRHELAHVLGLLDSEIFNAPFRPASHTSALGKVTSHDVYALYAKYVKRADDAFVKVPPYIPYMTADMPLPDIASAAVSVLVALMLDRVFWRRKNA